MKKILKKATIILLIFAIIATTAFLFGCEQEREKQREAKAQAAYLSQQQTMEETVAQTEMHEYEYRCVTLNSLKSEGQTTPLDENADYYITCTDTTDSNSEKSLIYVYQDIKYDESKAYRLCDVYSATPLDRIPSDAKIFLYCHAGGWIMGNRHSENDTIVPSLVKAGFVVFSIEYALFCGINQSKDFELIDFSLEGVMDMASKMISPKISVSFEDMMDDISTFFDYLADDFIPAHDITTTKVAVGGYSAGAHLATLYAYHYHPSTSKLKIAFCMSLAGPVTLNDGGYQYFMEKVKERYGSLLSLLKNTIAGIVSSDKPIDISTYAGMDMLIEYLDKYQATTYIDKNVVPFILCYSKKGVEEWNYFPAENDGLVPFSVYENYAAKLTANRVVHIDKVVDTHTHLDISYSKAVQKFLAQTCKAYAKMYME